MTAPVDADGEVAGTKVRLMSGTTLISAASLNGRTWKIINSQSKICGFVPPAGMEFYYPIDSVVGPSKIV